MPSVTNEGAIIPVKPIDRTLAQSERDMVTRLERGPIVPPSRNASVFPWFNEIESWVDNRLTRWDQIMDRLRRDAFTLFPSTFGGDDLFGHVPAIMSGMRHHMQAMEAFNENDPFGHFNTIMSGMHRHMEAMERHVNSIMQEMSSNAFGGGQVTMVEPAYEPDEHGRPKYIARFNLEGFKPDDVQVNAGNRQLTVRARKMEQTANSRSAREFYRMITLPDTINEADITSRLTKDGILVVEAPVKPSDYNRITYGTGQLALPGEPGVVETRTSDDLAVLGRQGLTLVENQAGGPRIHIETPIEGGYKAEHLSVRAKPGEIQVCGSKPVRGSKQYNQTRHLNEFVRAYRIPGSVDTEQIKSKLRNGTFIVEAPLIRWD